MTKIQLSKKCKTGLTLEKHVSVFTDISRLKKEKNQMTNPIGLEKVLDKINMYNKNSHPLHNESEFP